MFFTSSGSKPKVALLGEVELRREVVLKCSNAYQYVVSAARDCHCHHCEYLL